MTAAKAIKELKQIKKAQNKKTGANRVRSARKKKTKIQLPEWTEQREQELIAYIKTLIEKAPNGIVQLVIDLFCGAGGTSEGIEQAETMGIKNSVIIAGINHDLTAIHSQFVNHPRAYYSCEDIKLANLDPIIQLLEKLRVLFPKCPVFIWASVECTNHSQAKGGKSREADSRTQAWDLNRYITTINPDGIWLENVKEFEVWGPLIEKVDWVNKKGKKVKASYPPVGEAAAMAYWWNKINNGEVGTCPVDYKFEGTGKKKKLVDWGPTWVTDWRFAGSYYQAWTKEVEEMGYHFESRLLNAADFGVPQNRLRLFVLFMRKGWPLCWPEPTHSKTGSTGFFSMQPHVPVKVCLDFSNEGRSVFEPGHVRKPKTWKRLDDGLIKFVAGGKKKYQAFKSQHTLVRIAPGDLVVEKIIEEVGTKKEAWMIQRMGGNEKTGSPAGNSSDNPAQTCYVDSSQFYLSKLYSSHNNTRPNAGQSIEAPCHTVTTFGAGSLMEMCFITKTHGDGGGQLRSINQPAGTVACKDQMSFVNCKKLPENFIYIYQGTSIGNSIDNPANTVTSDSEKLSLIGVKYFISRNYTGGGQSSSIQDPIGTIPTVPKTELVSVRKGWISDDQYDNVGSSLDDPSKTITASRHHHYLLNPSWYSQSSTSVDHPSMTIVARQDKAPIYLMSVESEQECRVLVPVFEDDSAEVIRVKEFMALYNIYDIKKRMLMIEELLKIQGFPESYFLAGGSTDKKKMIGNAVPPAISKAIAESMYMGLLDLLSTQKAA